MRNHVVTLTALALLLATGCSNKLSGEIRVETTSNGSWTIKPDSCNSGQRQQFYGVDLAGGGNKMRAISDPKDGHTLVLPLPDGSGQTLVVDAKGCKTFDVDIERQNSTINDITNVKGRIQIDCTNDTGSVKGEVQFENCH